MSFRRFLTLPLVAALLCLAFFAGLIATPRASAAPESAILHVDRDAGGANDGSSWANAFTDLQAALTAVQSGDEIWVATGVYTPGTARTSTFALRYQVAIYGGFAGTETARDERDWATNVTVLSGDIDGDDTVDANGVVTNTTNIQGNNAYHVVTADANNGMPPSPSTNYGTAILDGFTITGGSANGSGASGNGGGFYNFIAFPTLRNITFQGNQAVNGGGMFIINSGPALTNVIFRNNTATGYGGGIFATTPSANAATTLINSLFEGNSALQGGGMAIDNTEGPQLINVTFANNDALQGGGLYNANSVIADSVTLRNSILWGNTASGQGNQLYNMSANPTLHYTLYANGTGDVSGNPIAPGSSNNLTSDPQFADAASGNFRLQATSPAIDVGDNTAIPSGVTTDLAGDARIQNNIVDIGAYESAYTPTAATVGDFAAALHPDRVRLHWTTLNEVGLTGFHLYRGLDAAGPGDRITGAPLPSQGAGGLEGFAYAYDDFTPRPAETPVYYWLEELHSDGSYRHGPLRVGGAGSVRVFLPLVER